MSVYCTTSDVQDFFKDVTFSAQTKVTLTEVGDIIIEKSNYIDGRLDNIYVTPITGTQALSMIKHCAEHLVAAEIWERLRPAGLPKDESNWGFIWNKAAEDMLTRIVGPTKDPRDMVILLDAVALPGQIERNAANLVDSGVADLGSTDSGYAPMFTTGEIF